jgi:hypothetical protein
MKTNGDYCLKSLPTAVLLLFFSLLVSNARAATLSYTVNMTGPNEFPANTSLGFGSGLISYDNTAHTLNLGFSFQGLTGTTTASHIHAATTLPFTGTAGVATTTPTFAGFPLGVMNGSYTNLLDLTASTSWNPAYITANGGTTAGAEAALAAAMASGEAYLNIHTTSFPGGEIRGFLIAVPEPSAMALIGLGAAAWAFRRKKAA